MRILGAVLFLFAVGGAAQAFLSSPPPTGEVLVYLQTMDLCPELKAALAPLLGAGLDSGRATPQVSLLLLQQLSSLPRCQAEDVLTVFYLALERGFIVDTGLTGSSLMNRVLMVLQMGKPCDAVVNDLRLRYNLLVSTQQALLEQGVIGVGPQGPGGPLLPQDRLVLETAWAIADVWASVVPGQRGEPMEPFVRARLLNLRGLVLAPSTVDPLMAVLTPELSRISSAVHLDPKRRSRDMRNMWIMVLVLALGFAAAGQVEPLGIVVEPPVGELEVTISTSKPAYAVAKPRRSRSP